MKKNSYSRYVLSDLYKEKLMHAAITAAKKSGIFHFVKRDYFRSTEDSSDLDSDISEHELYQQNNLATSHNSIMGNAKAIRAIVNAVGNASTVTAAVAALALSSNRKKNT